MLKRTPSGLLYRSLLLTALLALALSSPTSAQRMTVDTTCPCRLAHLLAAQLPDSGSPSSDEQVARLRLARRAQNYSLLGTIIPLPTLFLTYPGLLVGPSLGYFHAGRPERAWTGIGIRALATGGMISSFAICGWDCGSGDAAYSLAWAVFITSGGVFLGSAIYDIATVRGAVLHQSGSPNKATWMVSPRYFADARAVGVQLRIGF